MKELYGIIRFRKPKLTDATRFPVFYHIPGIFSPHDGHTPGEPTIRFFTEYARLSIKSVPQEWQ
jgi:hypothetical protein